MNLLASKIQREIAEGGAISFARFMEAALYDSESGYYERHSQQIGKRGDFFTNISVGSTFGRLLAFQFAVWVTAWEELNLSNSASTRERGNAEGKKPKWIFLESGAHDGRLAQDILDWVGSERPRLLGGVEYWILEPSARRRARQEMRLQPWIDQVRWFSSWGTIPEAGVRGIIFSNELLDAFPVHRLGWDAEARRWFEWGVEVENGEFVWVRLRGEQGAGRLPATDGFWPDLPNEVLAVLPDGFVTEVSPAGAAWWQRAASNLSFGVLLTVDYGLAEEEFFAPHRSQGTLRAYRDHRVSANVLACPGEQDLTAHVNFTALQRAGENSGLQTWFLNSQPEFLVEIAKQAWRPEAGFGTWSAAETREFRTLVHPEHLGRSFQVLGQGRGPEGFLV